MRLTIAGWKKGHVEFVQFGKNLHGVGLPVSLAVNTENRNKDTSRIEMT